LLKNLPNTTRDYFFCRTPYNKQSRVCAASTCATWSADRNLWVTPTGPLTEPPVADPGMDGLDVPTDQNRGWSMVMAVKIHGQAIVYIINFSPLFCMKME